MVTRGDPRTSDGGARPKPPRANAIKIPSANLPPRPHAGAHPALIFRYLFRIEEKGGSAHLNSPATRHPMCYVYVDNFCLHCQRAQSVPLRIFMFTLKTRRLPPKRRTQAQLIKGREKRRRGVRKGRAKGAGPKT